MSPLCPMSNPANRLQQREATVGPVVGVGRVGERRRPCRADSKAYGHPWHPMLVTVPIGAWITALVFDISSHIVDDPGFLTRGAEWLIAIGVLGALAAATIGFLDLLAIPTGTAAFRTGLIHMSLNLAVTGAYVGNFFWRHGTYAAGGTAGAWPLQLAAVSSTET